MCGSSVEVEFFGIVEEIVVEGFGIGQLRTDSSRRWYWVFDDIFWRRYIFNFLDFGVRVVTGDVETTSGNVVMFDLIKMDGACFCTGITERLDCCTRSIGIEFYDSVRS